MAQDDFDDGIFEDDDLASEVETDVGGGAQEQEAEISRAVVEAFRQRGAALPDDMDDDTLFANIAALNERARSAPDPMELAELREIRARYRQERDGQKPAETAEKPAETKPAARPRVEYPSEAEQYTQWDEKTGMYVPKSQAFPNVAAVEAMNKWYRQSEENKKRLLADPLSYLYEAGLNDKFSEFEKSLEQRILEKLQTEQQQKATDAEVNAWWNENGPKLYEVDASGYVKRDLSGQAMVTPQGKRFEAILNELKQQGFEGHGAEKYAFDQSVKWAKRRASRQETEAVDETNNGNGQATSEDLKKGFVQKGRATEERNARSGKTRVLDRSASVVNAAENGQGQNGGEGFAAIATRKAMAKGLSLN